MKATVLSIIVAIILIGGAFMLANNSGSTDSTVNANNVSIVDGKQIIEITARGGYKPRNSVAKAGIPTIIRFETSGTFDCSSSVRIPSLNIFKSLPQSGSTDIDVGTQSVGKLVGSCGMGMYPFSIEFKG